MTHPTPYPTEARTLTFNKDNWSGEDITVKVRKGNKFSLYDYDFSLVDVTPKDQGDEKPGDKFYFRKLDIVGDGWEYPLGSIQWFDGDKTKTAMDDPGFGIERDAFDPVEAAVKLLCNII